MFENKNFLIASIIIMVALDIFMLATRESGHHGGEIVVIMISIPAIMRCFSQYQEIQKVEQRTRDL